MNTPTKVVIEIDAKSHAVTVFAGDEVMFTRKMNMVGLGRAVGEKDQPDIQESLSDFGVLADEIEGMELDVFGVGCELARIADDEGVEG